jgi:hypothetical protein
LAARRTAFIAASGRQKYGPWGPRAIVVRGVPSGRRLLLTACQYLRYRTEILAVSDLNHRRVFGNRSRRRQLLAASFTMGTPRANVAPIASQRVVPANVSHDVQQSRPKKSYHRKRLRRAVGNAGMTAPLLQHP